MAKKDTTVQDHIKAAFDETADARRNYQINRAFLSGRQHISYDTRIEAVRDLPPATDRLRVTANKLWPSSRSLMAAMLRRPLQFQVMPESADAASSRASRLAESVVRTRSHSRNWENLRANLTWGAWIGGTSALSLDWDPEADRPLGTTDDGRKYGTGDTVESVLSVLDFAVEPGARDAEQAKWWVRSEALPPKEVQKRYKLDKEPPADASTATVSFSYDLTRAAARPELTNVHTYYARPCGDYEGKVCVVVDEEVVDEAPWPFSFTDKLNISVVRETIVPGRWYGDTILTAAVPLQAALNAAFSALIDHTRKAGNARMLIPQSVVDMLDELTDEAGQSLAYPDGAEKPEWLSPPQLPNYVIETPKLIAEQIDDMLALHDVSRGQAPGRVDSGLGLSILTENDATPLSAITAQVARAFSGLASQLLATYAAKVKDTRKQKSYGPGQPAEDVNWSGKDLLHHTHAEVPADALVPRSRVASNQLAMDMFEKGIITDPLQALKLIEFPDIDDAIQALDPHVAKARREAHRIRAGHQQIPADIDGPTHVMEHMLDRLTEAFELSDPEMQELAVKHEMAHQAIYERLGIPWPTMPGMPEPKAPAAPMPPADPLAAPMQAPMLPPPPALPITAPVIEEPALTEVELIASMLDQPII